MGPKRKFGPSYAAAMAERYSRERQARQLIEAMSDVEAKAALMLLARDLFEEILEVIEEHGRRK